MSKFNGFVAPHSVALIVSFIAAFAALEPAAAPPTLTATMPSA